MATLTAELRREIEKAGEEPVRIEDTETHATYVLLRAEVYDRLRPPPEPEDVDLLSLPIPEGLRRSKEAFLRDLPELLARKRLHGRWVLYHRDKRVGIWRNPRWMDRRIVKLGLKHDEYYASLIRPRSPEPEEVDRSFYEFDEVEPSS